MVVCCCTLGIGTHAFGLGLGDANVASALGQPLHMTVPVTIDSGGEPSQDCVRIVQGTGIDAVPSLNGARVTFDVDHSQLLIETPLPVTEPALRVVVELGCTQRIRREFAVLLDPPGMAAPTSNFGGPGQPGQGAPALGLGMAQISAVLGQRLSIRVPAVGADAGSLTADCVHLADPISSEGAPVLRQATIRVAPVDTGSLIDITTQDPVTEPAVRLALDVGCHDPLRREYAILLGLPTLAASNAEPVAAAQEAPPAAQEAKPAEPLAKPAAKPAPRRPRAVTAVPVSPQAHVPAVAAAETPGKAAPKPAAAGSDRLVLSSPRESVPGADSAAAPPGAEANAELLRRMDAMSRQIEALQAQLAAARQRQTELEHRASESREGWAWLMGALGGLLLGGALVMAWRQRAPVRQGSWESIDSGLARVGEPRVAAAHASASADVSEIGGRGAMAPAPTTIHATTEPSLTDAKNSEITVTELHDTVQVIKELYATVLERSTSAGAGESTGGRPTKPLELDLRTPTGGGVATGSTRSPAGPTRAGGSRAPAGGETKRGLEERFTELPTEVGLDLDLSSVIAQAAPADAADVWLDLNEPRLQVAGAAAAGSRTVAETAPQPAARDSSREHKPSLVERADPARSAERETAVVVSAVRSEAGSRAAQSDEQLTQTPTEVLIDIDVGATTSFSGVVDRPATRLPPMNGPDAERPRNTTSPLGPIDLQLDLSQPETKAPRRGGRSA